ncbi:hypothetical protein DFH07DRAFT_821992 [Mycena maculata]|uniref:RRM domain-containing protein n=1 Tax=Mycena maculata TaxID=230809 RepID=A0AAD7J1Z0_9AGAR|nr:hypothetical protein DFH07DRAFT_821992 [Mycena maculata]
MSKLYVGNLSWNTTTEQLRRTFEECGEVTDSICMVDRDTGRARGFGFVTFSNDQHAQNAIQKFNDYELDGRRLRVNIAGERSSGGGYSGGYNNNNSNDSGSGSAW